MEDFYHENSGIPLGSNALVVVEVIPIQGKENRAEDHVATRGGGAAFSLAFAKLHLQGLALQSRILDSNNMGLLGLGIQWETSSIGTGKCRFLAYQTDDASRDTGNANGCLAKGYLFNKFDMTFSNNKMLPGDIQSRPILFFPSEDTTQLDYIPCWVIGYSLGSCYSSDVSMTSATLVRILPGEDKDKVHCPSSSYCDLSLHLEGLVGEAKSSMVTKSMQEEIRHNHHLNTIQELSLRMSLQLAEPVSVGTTQDTSLLQERQAQRRIELTQATRRYFCRRQHRGDTEHATFVHLKQSEQSSATTMPSSSSPYAVPPIMWDCALLVHCPHHGAGKTTLLEHIAQNVLQCKAVHVLSQGPLLAKYGSQADDGLESTIHAITISAAAAAANSSEIPSVCIILDRLDSFMPPALSARSSAGDVAAPVLNSNASYLKRLIVSLNYRRHFPFPAKNPFYNLGGKGGVGLAVRFCLVAIATCPDNGWRSAQKTMGGIGHSSCILDAVPTGTYRLPTSDKKTRLRALKWACQQESLAFTKKACIRLESLASMAVWCRGSLFATVARTLRQMLDKDTHQDDKVTSTDLDIAFSSLGRHIAGFSNFAIQATESVQRYYGGPSNQRNGAFHIVGGNNVAKRSLEDAVTLDSTKREMLESMGIDPPVGVLLYGPPGCGKTLLAKSIAFLLATSGTAMAQTGGLFIALNSSQIVQSEIGASEKLIVSAFQSARENAPSVVFIDEFQAMVLERGSNGSSKVSSALLQCLDDIRQWRTASNVKSESSGDQGSAEQCATAEKEVVVLGATNTPWMVDKAFLRPGRFDRIVHVGLPSDEERESILNVHMRKLKIAGGPDIQFQLSHTLAKHTKGYSGAELSSLCKAATVQCLLENSEFVAEGHFMKELEEGGGKSNEELVERNENWRPGYSF